MVDLLEPPRVIETNSHITFHEIEVAVVLQVSYILRASVSMLTTQTTFGPPRGAARTGASL